MLADVTDEAARRFGDATCLVAPDGWAMTFRQVATASKEVAAGMAERGAAEGDVVVIDVPTSPDHIVAAIACARLGAVAAAVNHRLTEPERATLVRLVEPTVTVSSADLGESPDTVLGSLRRRGTEVATVPPDPDRAVAVVFTSGTTGRPKGAVFCERQIRFITGVDTGMAWGGGGASIGSSSLAHLGPTTKLAGALMRGGPTFQVARWRAADALELTERHAMPGVAGIPTQVALMLRHPSFDERDLTSVRAVVMGGAPATPALIREARARFDAPVAVRYSCTEAGVGTGTGFTDPPDDAEVSVGRPHAGISLTIRDPDSGDPVAHGEVGEVCFASPATMDRYWNDPAATAAATWPDGAVRTGDLGRLDPAGRLVLAGRTKEMYVRGGYNVFPIEVEAALAALDGVADAAVVARPDEVMGEVGVAYVVAAPGRRLDPDRLRALVAERLAHHKIPAELVVVDELPLTVGDKVDKRALTARAARDGC